MTMGHIDGAGAVMNELRIWNEWGHPWPLWDARGPLSPDDLGLGEKLGADLMDWQTRWEGLQSDAARWGDPQAQVRWEAEGDRLVARVREQLGGSVDVVSDFRFGGDPGVS